MEPFTLEHFRSYVGHMVFEDGTRRGLEEWQFEPVADVFRGFLRNLWIIPEGNGKSTLVSLLGLYGADFSQDPWIPVGAAGAKQARIIHQQARGFIERTPGLQERFRVYDGYLRIASRVNGGQGIEIYAHDPKTGDGVIPSPFALVDELHNHPDMRLWNLWAGKLRKRNAQIIGISTAGEPEAPFELMRDKMRRKASTRKRDGAHLRAESAGSVLHEWMVPKDEMCEDMAAVKAANPLSTITEATLAADFAEVDDLGMWKRLKCNRPVRASISAITDKEWDDAQTDVEIPEGAEVDVGLDIAFKWDTTAIVPRWCSPDWEPPVLPKPAEGVKGRPARGFVLLGKAEILVPPRDGSSMHPDEIKNGVYEVLELYKIRDVVMDMERAADIAAWLEDELGLTVVDRSQSNKLACQDYEAFMDGLRNGWNKHTGDPGLRSHVLHAIARRLPGGDRRFDRPAQGRQNLFEQDRRVIDALTAAGMVVSHSLSAPPQKSVYAMRREMFATP